MSRMKACYIPEDIKKEEEGPELPAYQTFNFRSPSLPYSIATLGLPASSTLVLGFPPHCAFAIMQCARDV